MLVNQGASALMGAGTMMTCKTQVVEKCKALDRKMLEIYRFGHALNLVTHDLIRNFKEMKTTLSASKEISILIKKLPQ